MNAYRRMALGVLLGMLSLGLVSCSKSSSGGGGGVAASPADLSYPEALVIYIVNQIISSASPSLTGGDPTEFTVDPALPDGLTLDLTTGVLSGTPTTIVPAGDYVITAQNNGGMTTFVINITVNPEAPANLSYPAGIIASEGVDLPAVMPTIDGGAVDQWSISPGLPAGLTFDTTNGTISGTPVGNEAPADYTITASNVTGSAVAIVNLTVMPTAPCNLAYSTPDAVYIPGMAIAPNVPSSQCGAVDTYSIDQALPAGLAFDPATGMITGTPTTDSPETEYEITATNMIGAVTVRITIRVSPRYYFTADSAVVPYDGTTGDATFSQSLWIEEDPNNPGFPHALTGFSMGLRHNPDLLTVNAVTPTALLTSMNSGAGPAFVGLTTLPDGFTIGFVFSFTLEDDLLATGPQNVLSVTYDTNPVSLAGNPLGTTTLLQWADDLGSPPVTNIVVEKGIGAAPVVTHGTVQLVPSP
ncbi:MAG: Ig domain-containing protein [Planctomycetota bacterium]